VGEEIGESAVSLSEAAVGEDEEGSALSSDTSELMAECFGEGCPVFLAELDGLDVGVLEDGFSRDVLLLSLSVDASELAGAAELSINSGEVASFPKSSRNCKYISNWSSVMLGAISEAV